jgi:hypothetical protein
MQDWDTYKQAGMEYSRMCPRIAFASFTAAADTKLQTPPVDCLDIQSCSYGDRAEPSEVYLDDVGATPAWAFLPGQLFLTPAPALDEELGTTTPFTLVYSARHLPNEDTQTFPTIPVEHLHFVDDLEQAITLELEADDAAKGPMVYSFGQTQVSRAEAVNTLRARAAQLRLRVRQAVETPLALWS